MQGKKVLNVLSVSVTVALAPSLAADKGVSLGRPDFVACRDFSWTSLLEPEDLFWPAYFWYWNGPPTPDVLRQRVRDAWSKRKGPGWPGPYHQRALQFETESRGSGLLGPVRLQLAAP